MGEARLAGEVIALDHNIATIEVYEETNRLRPGEPLYATGAPLSVLLGPGCLRTPMTACNGRLRCCAMSKESTFGPVHKPKLFLHENGHSRPEHSLATLSGRAVCWALFRRLR